MSHPTDEAQSGGILDRYWFFSLVIIPFLMIFIICLLLYVISGFEGFKNSCVSFGGNFYVLENTSCSLGHQNCIYRCNLNEKSYSLDEFTTRFGFIYGYNKQFCIDDCEYENKKAGELICVC